MMDELGTIQDMLTMHDFYVIDAKIDEIARALGLEDIGLDRDVTELSGGQRTKILLGKLLLEKPDILLLDEPTNYLDAEHIAWLKRYLQAYENAFVLISHDIPFLNSVVNLIYHMDNQELNRYVGDYDKFQEVYEVKKAQKEAAYNRQQQEISELKDFVARNKARVATRNMAMSRQKKLDKMDVIELAREKPKPEFNFRTARTPGRFVVTAKDLVMAMPETQAAIQQQIDGQMVSDEVQGLIAMNIESAMAGDAVQSEIAAAVEQATGADSALIKPLNTLATQLTGFDAFYQGLLQYTNGVDSAARAASQVADGTARLQAGAAQVSGGAASLQQGSRSLTDGAARLAGGSSELAEGTGELRGRTSDMDSQLNDKIDELIDGFTGADYEICSFASEKNTQVDAVQFVMTTPAIEEAEARRAPAQEAQTLSLWQRLLALFQ